jgi:hypothetical protein
MKSFTVLVFVLALLCCAHAIPTIISNAVDIPTGVDCLNGISCAPGQTCMSNSTGTGNAVSIKRNSRVAALPPLTLAPQYACSPLPNAVRCMDARFSCPASTTCAEEIKCVAADGSVSDGILNVDPFFALAVRDFGARLLPAALEVAAHCLQVAMA